MRVVQGLEAARACERPACIPKGKPRGAKAAGLRYERALAKALPPGWLHGQWFEFWDANGHGYCQPDFILVEPGRVLVLEAKYTWVLEAHAQLMQLYAPVLRAVFKRPVIGVVVCKRLVPGARAAYTTLEEAIRWPVVGGAVLHWIGVGPVDPPSRASAQVPVGIARVGA
jgi:hypothetical protein